MKSFISMNSSTFSVEKAVPENVQVLTSYVGDELEIMDPYGGALPAYGLCYETLRKSIKKLVKKLNEENESEGEV